jgi:predicted transcriptional regulator
MLIMVELTEFEKAILLTFLIMTKGSLRKRIYREDVTARVPMRRRAICRRWMLKLVEKGLLVKKDEYYSLTKAGVVEARRLLVTGTKFLLP